MCQHIPPRPKGKQVVKSLPAIPSTQDKFQISLLDQFYPPSESLDPALEVFPAKITEICIKISVTDVWRPEE